MSRRSSQAGKRTEGLFCAVVGAGRGLAQLQAREQRPASDPPSSSPSPCCSCVLHLDGRHLGTDRGALQAQLADFLKTSPRGVVVLRRIDQARRAGCCCARRAAEEAALRQHLPCWA